MSSLSYIGKRLSQALAGRPRVKRFATAAGILAIAALASFSIFATAPAPVMQDHLEKAWPVSVVDIKPQALSPVFGTYGRVESNNMAELRTSVVAEVASIYAREGQWVEKGQLLLELRKDELVLQVSEKKADLDQEKAQLASIQSEYRLLEKTSEHYEQVWELSQKKLKRQQDLREKGMISQALMDDAIQAAGQAAIAYQSHVRTLADFPNRIAKQKAQLNHADSQWQQSLLNLEKAEIRAPFSGPILAVSVAVGDHSELSTPLVTMADSSQFVIRAPVPNIYVQRLRDYVSGGHPIQSQAMIGGRNVAPELERLASDVKAGQSGLDAFFRVDHTTGWELPEIGRVINLTVTLPVESDVVALPVQSIYENDRVYRVDQDRLQAVTVARVGDYQTLDGQFRVLVRSSALESGQTVITTQLPRAISGLLVAPREQSAALASAR